MRITETPTKLPAWDYAINSFDGWTLEILAGIDYSLRTSPVLILRFAGVTYVDCPTEFSHARIRLAGREERKAVAKRQAIDKSESVYALDAETIGHIGTQTFFIVADSLDIRKANNQILRIAATPLIDR